MIERLKKWKQEGKRDSGERKGKSFYENDSHFVKRKEKKKNDRSARNGSREGNFEIDLKIERILPAALGG